MGVRRWRHLARANKGMALAMTAVMLPVLVLIMAFAIDIGIAQAMQGRLEAAVNQAADAGVRRLPDEDGAANTADAVARLALADVDTMSSPPSVGVLTRADSITVRAAARSQAFFGRFAGRTGYDLEAEATRRTGG